MKKIIPLFALMFLFTTSLLGQVYNFTAYSVTYKFYDENRDYWTDWADWSRCNIEVLMNVPEGNIKIFANHYQSYNIMYKEEQEYFEGDDISSLYCVDQDGIACRLKLVIRANSKCEIYIEYSDIKWIYSLKKSLKNYN